MVAWAATDRLLPDERERPDGELADEAEPAEEIAVLEPEVWREVVRRGLNVAVLAAVEAQALGGLVVLLRASGLTAGGATPPGTRRPATLPRDPPTHRS